MDPEREYDEYQQYLKILEYKGDNDYNYNQKQVAQILADYGLTYEELLNVNFNADNNIRYDILMENPCILKSYAQDIIELRTYCVQQLQEQANKKGIPIERYNNPTFLAIINTAMALIHEKYYISIEKQPGISQTGISNYFTETIALESLASWIISCPFCDNKLCEQHIQYRGDLFCFRCKDVDIDVKSNIKSALKHCFEYRTGNYKAIKTPYVIYKHNLNTDEFCFILLNCFKNEQRRISRNIDISLLKEITEGAISLVDILKLGPNSSGYTCIKNVTIGKVNATQGNATQGNATQGNSTQGNSTQGNSTQGNSTQGNSTQGDPTQGDPDEWKTVGKKNRKKSKKKK